MWNVIDGKIKLSKKSQIKIKTMLIHTQFHCDAIQSSETQVLSFFKVECV